jgi:hypothetical protein
MAFLAVLDSRLCLAVILTWIFPVFSAYSTQLKYPKLVRFLSPL